MIKCEVCSSKKHPDSIPMRDMLYNDLYRVVDDNSDDIGHIALRVGEDKVVDLNDIGVDSWWEDLEETQVLVEPLGRGESITLTQQ